jgi:hypothetical protein
MSPRLRPLLRLGALVTSLALAALFVAYRVSSASREREARPATPPVVSPAAGTPPAPAPDAAKPKDDATEEGEYFPGSKSMIGLGPWKPVKRSEPAAVPTPPPQAPAK